MKLIYLIAGLAGSSALAADTELKSNRQKASYAIGQQIGGNMREQGVEVDVDVLAMSIKEALAGKKSRLSDEEIQKAMISLQQEVQKKQQELAANNLATGGKYLEENKKKPGVKTTASGLQYKVLREGSGEQPTDQSVVKVHYRGTLTDGNEFDSSYKRNKPAEFPVTGVIKGWTEALKLMKTGSKWALTIPADLAYGPTGRPGIPANSVLLFDVELLEVVKKSDHAAKKK